MTLKATFFYQFSDRLRSLVWFAFSMILLFPVMVSAQTTKGAETGSDLTLAKGKTLALIIGISEYETIKPLNYADRDAMVFGGYLRYHPKWQLPESQIKVLLNKNAKNGDILEGLRWLKEESDSLDQIIIFFSGHGDVETDTEVNQGYLLAHNTPSSNYAFGGVSISMIHAFITTYTNHHKNVLLIVDACRSGELAGGQKGREMTNATLLKTWSGETKILSTQPKYPSYEDPKWGGGRGVFSYYLIKGMSGAADMNSNDTVTLHELEFYLTSNVGKDTNGEQVPVIDGGGNKFKNIMSLVDKKEIEKWAKNEVPVYGKSYVDQNYNPEYIYTEVLKTYTGKDWLKFETDSLIIKFNAALEKKNYITDSYSAKFFYTEYVKKYGEGSTSREMKRKLKSALINGTQDLINKHLSAHHFLRAEDFKTGFAYSDEIINMIDTDDPLYQYYQAKRNFFGAGYKYGLYTDNISNDQNEFDKVINELNEAIKVEPQAAYLYEMMGTAYVHNKDYKNAEKYLLKAAELSPTWLLPKYYLGWTYYYMGNKVKAINYLEESLKNDTTASFAECKVCLKILMINVNVELKRYNDAEKMLRAELAIDPTAKGYYFFYTLFDVLTEQKKYSEAKEILNWFEQVDTTDYSKVCLLTLQYYEKKYNPDTLLIVGKQVETLFLGKPEVDSSTMAAIYWLEYLIFKDSKSFHKEDAIEMYLMPCFNYDPTDEETIYEIFRSYSDDYFEQYMLDFIPLVKSKNKDQEVLLECNIYMAFYYFNTDEDDLLDQTMKELVDNEYFTCEEWKYRGFPNLAKHSKIIKKYQQQVCGK